MIRRIALILGLLFLLGGCRVGDVFTMPNGNTAIVDQVFTPDGRPTLTPTTEGPIAQYTEFDDPFVYIEPVENYDQMCALVSFCPFWDSPKVYFYHTHIVHQLQGNQFGGFWLVFFNGNHMYRVCEQLIPSSDPDCYGSGLYTAPRG